MQVLCFYNPFPLERDMERTSVNTEKGLRRTTPNRACVSPTNRDGTFHDRENARPNRLWSREKGQTVGWLRLPLDEDSCPTWPSSRGHWLVSGTLLLLGFWKLSLDWFVAPTTFEVQLACCALSLALNDIGLFSMSVTCGRSDEMCPTEWYVELS